MQLCWMTVNMTLCRTARMVYFWKVHVYDSQERFETSTTSSYSLRYNCVVLVTSISTTDYKDCHDSTTATVLLLVLLLSTPPENAAYNNPALRVGKSSIVFRTLFSHSQARGSALLSSFPSFVNANYPVS